ncbi:MAG: hypothetical protein M1826_007266 [Phylliscum demangeonii]|nr:MAG: hypothetical protein M1826_007266 [Phylliscum demangeonii]
MQSLAGNSSRGHRPGKSAATAATKAVQHLANSNSTMHAFVGGTPKAWMVPGMENVLPSTSGASVRRSSNAVPRPASAAFSSTSHAPTTSLAASSSAEPRIAHQLPSPPQRPEELVLPSPAPSDGVVSPTLVAHQGGQLAHLADKDAREIRTSNGPSHGQTQPALRVPAPAPSPHVLCSQDDVPTSAQRRRMPRQVDHEMRDVQQSANVRISGGLPPSNKRPRTERVVPQPSPAVAQPSSAAARLINPPASTLASSPHFSLRTYLPLIAQHVQSRGGITAVEPIVEYRRIQLLESACRRNDYTYLALHQIYCLGTYAHQSSYSLEGVGELLHAAYAVLQRLLCANTMQHLAWYAEFPAPVDYLIQVLPSYRFAVQEVKTVLAALPVEWLRLEATCAQRGFPVLAHEITGLLQTRSPTFLGVLFRACFQKMWPGLDTACRQRLEAAFENDLGFERDTWARLHTAHAVTPARMQEHVKGMVFFYKEFRALQAQAAALPLPHTTTLGSSPPMGQGERRNSHSIAPPMAVAQPIRTPSTGIAAVPPRAQARQRPEPAPLRVDVPPSFPMMPPATPGHSGYAMAGQSPRVPFRFPGGAQIPTPGQLNAPPYGAHANLGHGALMSPSPRPVPGQPPMGMGRTTYSHSVPPSPSLVVTPSHVRSAAGLESLRYPLLSTAPSPHALPGPPTPAFTALHQAHLQSPHLESVDGRGQVDAGARLYRFVRDFALAPALLPSGPPTILRFAFPVSQEEVERIPAESDRQGIHLVPARLISEGSLMFRIRCCLLDDADMAGTTGEPACDLARWLVKEMAWPGHVFLDLNGRYLDTQRRFHHGKDLSIDITRDVREGVNTLSLVVMPGTDAAAGARYALAVERLDCESHATIVRRYVEEEAPIGCSQTVAEIKASFAMEAANDELAIVGGTITLGITDPFTSRIFDLPVRSVSCKHRDCFDLETFLATRSDGGSSGGGSRRSSSDPAGAHPNKAGCISSVHEWRCPLCGVDARPTTLKVDGFLANVRAHLELRHELDAKAIVVSCDGTWAAKLPAPEPGTSQPPPSASANQFPFGPNAPRNTRYGAWSGDGAMDAVPSSAVVVELDD